MANIPRSIRLVQAIIVLNLILCVLGIVIFFWMVNYSPTMSSLRALRYSIASPFAQYNYASAVQLSIVPMASIILSAIVLFSLRKSGQGLVVPCTGLICMIVLHCFQCQAPIFLLIAVMLLLTPLSINYIKHKTVNIESNTESAE